MEDQLTSLPAQFEWEPAYEGTSPSDSPSEYVVCGMGGSHLAASLLLVHDATLPIRIHRDYGLPPVAESSRIILSSYSGNTEEVLDAARVAVDAGLSAVVITTGGALADFARANNLPLILLPDTGAEPRGAFGYELLSLAYAIDPALVPSVREAGSAVAPLTKKDMGVEVGAALDGRIPLIYASTDNEIVARVWKIFFNETAKIPAFSYSVPEFCHNELSGFDVAGSTEDLSQRFVAIFLTDESDHVRNQKRMEIARDLLNERGIDTLAVPLEGEMPLTKALEGIATGVYAALTLAHAYGVPDAKTPLIAEFKERMKDV